MTFGQPLWFWGFALFPVLIALFFRNERARSVTLKKLIAARLIDRLAGSVSSGKRQLRFLLLLLGLACVIVSLTQPRWGFSYQERTSKGRDVLIAIDTSRSMLANDLAPSRLVRAKLAAEDLITQLPGDRIGLIAFAGGSFLQAPLTADHGAVLASLHEIDTEIIPRGGTNIAEAIETAVEAFGKGESDNRALVIFTDGEELDANGIEAAKKQKEIAKIFTVGVGSTEGTVISIPGNRGSEYLTDPNGQIVKSRLDEERLRAIAEASGGFYLRLQNGLAEMRQLVRDGLGIMSEKDINTDVARQPIERYQWPLGIGLLLLVSTMLMGERRRVGKSVSRNLAAATAAFGIMVGIPAPASGNAPADLYAAGKYADAQRAYEELLKKHPESDRLAFNHGAAAYKNRDFRSALESFGKALATKDQELRAQAEYNLGNTLFQQALGGKKGPDIKTLESALGHFDQARQIASNKENPQYNYDATKQLIEQLKQQQEQKEQEQKDQKKDQDKDKKQDQKDKQDKGDGKDQKDQQQGGDQQQKDQQSGDQQDQKKDGQGKQGEDEKNEPGKQEQKEGQEGGDQKKKDQQGGKSEQKEQDKQGGKEGEQTDQQPEGEQKEGEQGKEEPKKEGELKNNPAPGQAGEQQEQGEPTPEQQAAEEAAAAAEGRMTESQAKALLDSLKSEDARVQLLNPRDRRSRERPLRDW
jgi:Ca-activated chloride channel family protein